jgi:cellulose synthase/poly-beta-1,6-N-acetylglucosamine synthase-like glycosyltransferase
MGTVCVEIAVRDDPHLGATLASLARQTRRPDRVLIAAATDSSSEFLRGAMGAAPELVVQVARFPGGVVDARAGAQLLIHEEVTAFLDSDETAPPDWLRLLVAPLEAGLADFSGGPTRPERAPQTSIERYMEQLERSIYEDLVPAHVTYLPLQNTAWRTAPLTRLGFDPRIPYAEDHDVETRATRAGLRGTYVPEAWVYHDPRAAMGLRRWARKRYRYLVAMAMSLMKNGELGHRLGERRRPVRHPLRFLEGAMKPVALVHARLRWSRVKSWRVVLPSPEPEPAR